MKPWTFASLFCGAGGGSLGFTQAGWECVGAFDADAEACADHEYLTGHPAHVADLSSITPAELAALCSGAPDVWFTSPPCKGFSSCQPIKRSRTEKYQALNSLAERGVMLALEAFPDNPPKLILLENVPRVTTRGRKWLDAIQDMLRAYGYACSETKHDCGEWGGLAQHRDRVLLVARHMEQVPQFLCEPPTQRVRGIGEALMELPVPLPGSDAGGPMHRLPQLAAINWVRLALIRAGHDWRDLPESVELPTRAGRQNGGFGVNTWDDGSHTVVSEGSVRNTWSSVQDPRITCTPRSTVYGVADHEEPLGTVLAAASHDNGKFSIADPRVECTRREGGHGVKRADQAATPVIGNAQIHNYPAAFADPRVSHPSRKGNYSVQDTDEPSSTVLAAATAYHGQNVADPRGHAEATHRVVAGEECDRILGEPIDLEDKRPCHLIIMAKDHTWHRPMTTLELAVLQGFPAEVDGVPLKLAGNSHGRWRGRIGNAVPPPTARAIAEAMSDVLEQAAGSSHFKLVGAPIWVGPEGEDAR